MKQHHSPIFIKLHVWARESGLMAEMPDRLWKLLTCLATYMDSNGQCYPSQKRLARDLGVSRQTICEMVRELREFRFQDQPVITVGKLRRGTPNGGRYAPNTYQLHPNCGLSFGPSLRSVSASVGEPRHWPVSEGSDTGNPDTNESRSSTRTKTNVVNAENSEPAQRRRRAAWAKLSPSQQIQGRGLALLIQEVLGAPDRNFRFYLQVAADAIRDGDPTRVHIALSRTKEAFAAGKVRTSMCRIFKAVLESVIQERSGVPLHSGDNLVTQCR